MPSADQPPPSFTEAVADKVTAGHVLRLRIEVTHGRGESLLPRDESQHDTESPQAKSLRARGFALVAAEPGAASVQRRDVGEGTVSTLELGLLALPDEPGAQPSTLPPLPVTLVKASGEVTTFCTHEHAVQITDPTENTPDATPRDVPPPQRQREHWQALEWALWALLAAAVVAMVAILGYRRWQRRPKPVAPPPPPVPAWTRALAALKDLEESELLPLGHYVEAVDRATDVLRGYLGERYGFEGLESTTDEVRTRLREQGASAEVRADVTAVLTESDLVKFAKGEMHGARCRELLAEVRSLVERTREPHAESPAHEERA